MSTLLRDMIQFIDGLQLSPRLQPLLKAMGERELFYATKDLLCLLREPWVKPGLWRVPWRSGNERHQRLSRLLLSSEELSSMFGFAGDQLLLTESVSDKDREAMLAPLRTWNGCRGHLFARPKETIPEGDEVW